MKFSEKIETFERIGIPEAERAYLAGASARWHYAMMWPIPLKVKVAFQEM